MHGQRPVSVLVAPLDWGLGHATRCIPIINALIAGGAVVRIAAGGSQKILLQQTFPHLEFLDLPGYGIRYRRGFFLKWALIARIPGILMNIRREQLWLRKTIRKYPFDIILSDNRYGLYHENCTSIFITHQLSPQSGIGKDKKNKLLQRIGGFMDSRILKWNYSFISKFTRCWIPDSENGPSFSGRLSHPSGSVPFAVQYIGILSRFHFAEISQIPESLLILVSGPEPQRTDFEKRIMKEIRGTNRRVTIVRGLPAAADNCITEKEKGVIVYNHLSDERLNKLILESQYILCRSGYSTIMDLLALKKNAIIIPTPGQTEQEYLATYLSERRWMYTIPENQFNLEQAIRDFNLANLIHPDIHESGLNKLIRDLISETRQGL